MKRKEMKLAAVILAGLVAVSGSDFSTHATQVMTVLPVAGVGLKLEEGTSVEELEHLNLGELEANEAVNAALTNNDIQVSSGQMQEETAKPRTANAQADTASQISEPEEETEEVLAEEEDSEEPEEDYGSLVIARVRDWVNVRSGPSTNSEIVGKLYNNSVGEMIRQEGDWYYIASGTVNGYVKAEYCVTGEEAEALVDEVSVKIARVNAETLNLRKKPNTNSSILKQLPTGAELEVISTEYDGWVEVDLNGTVGFVSADYVSVSISFVSAESIEEEAERLAKERAEREEAERRAQEEAQNQAAQQEAAAQSTDQTSEQPAQEAPAQEVAVISTTGSELGSQVANFALQYVGNPYVYGGTSLTNGADCSGFVLAVYAQFGVSLPHSATADQRVGTAVGSLAEAQPGDLVCYSGHVGIYIGNGQIVHASTPRTGIKISDANYKPYICIRRIFS